MRNQIVRERPESWLVLTGRTSGWLLPFFAADWILDWAAFGLGNWKFIEVLEYLSKFSVLIVVVLYFSEAGKRVKQRHYQAWQVINTAQGKGGNGGRIEALEELNADHVALVGVDVSQAFLQGVKLQNAKLVRSDFTSADLRDGNFEGAVFDDAKLEWANFHDANLTGVSFEGADMREVELLGSNLTATNFADADLAGADFRKANLQEIHWDKIRDITGANITGVRHPPEGFVAWALKHGAVYGENVPD